MRHGEGAVGAAGQIVARGGVAARLEALGQSVDVGVHLPQATTSRQAMPRGGGLALKVPGWATLATPIPARVVAEFQQVEDVRAPADGAQGGPGEDNRGGQVRVMPNTSWARPAQRKPVITSSMISRTPGRR